MSPYFQCHDCEHVNQCAQDNKICPFCGSSKGHIISDTEFREKRNTGAIRTVTHYGKKSPKKHKK
jgi:Zn finger protein HypA/HybF involved in hydrogenase expression